MKFTIDRSKWRCGDGHVGGMNTRGLGNTMLLNPEGFMCCLGQVSLQLGFDAGILARCHGTARLAEELGQDVPLFTKALESNKFASDAMRINDNAVMSDRERERALSRHFKKHGHEIEFTGEYVKP